MDAEMREKLAKAREVMVKEGKIAKRKKDKKLRESLVEKLRAPPASKPPLPGPSDPASWTKPWQNREMMQKQTQLVNNCESERIFVVIALLSE